VSPLLQERANTQSLGIVVVVVVVGVVVGVVVVFVVVVVVVGVTPSPGEGITPGHYPMALL
jgi:hypothetical protein